MESKPTFLDKAVEKVNKIKEDITPKIEEFSELAKEKLQETKENLAPKVAEFKEKAKENMEQAKEKATKASAAVQKKIKEDIAPKIEGFSERAKEKVTQASTAVQKKTKAAIVMICAVPFLLIGLFSGGSNLHVISIGVPAYKDYYNFRDISASENDAVRISELFGVLNNKLFSHVNNITLAEHGEARKKDILNAIRTVYKKAKDNDVVLIYFSGHGYTADNNYFLVPFEAEKDSIQKKGILPRELLGNNNVRTIVWIDACYSGMAERGLRNGNVNLLVSSAPDRASYSCSRGSIFTNNILDALKNCEADSNGDNTVSLQELAQYIGDDKNPIKKFDLPLIKCAQETKDF